MSGLGFRLEDVLPQLRNAEQRETFRTLVGLSADRLAKILGAFAVEHAQIKSDRLNDPKFAHYYRKHGLQFLDVIERTYFRKLNAGQISLDDFFQALKSYVASHHSGSQGRKRQREADHIIDHVLAQLVQELRLNRRGPSKPASDAPKRKPPRGGPDETPLERSVREKLESDGRE